MRDETRREQAVARETRELRLERRHLLLPPGLLASELAEQPLRSLELILGFLQAQLQRLGLAGSPAELVLEVHNLPVQVHQVLLALRHPSPRRVQGLGELPKVLLEGRDLLQDGGVLEVSLCPGREGRGGDGRAQDVLVLERGSLFLHQLLHSRAAAGRDVSGVKVDDLILDAPTSEEPFHRCPAGVRATHQGEHGE